MDTTKQTISPEAEKALADLQAMRDDFLRKFALVVREIRRGTPTSAQTPADTDADAGNLPHVEAYTMPDLQKILGLSRRTILDYFKDGRLKGQKIGGRWHVSPRNLQDFINGDTQPRPRA